MPLLRFTDSNGDEREIDYTDLGKDENGVMRSRFVMDGVEHTTCYIGNKLQSRYKLDLGRLSLMLGGVSKEQIEEELIKQLRPGVF